MPAADYFGNINFDASKEELHSDWCVEVSDIEILGFKVQVWAKETDGGLEGPGDHCISGIFPPPIWCHDLGYEYGRRHGALVQMYYYGKLILGRQMESPGLQKYFLYHWHNRFPILHTKKILWIIIQFWMDSFSVLKTWLLLLLVALLSVKTLSFLMMEFSSNLVFFA